jgi:hypothetical protein
MRFRLGATMVHVLSVAAGCMWAAVAMGAPGVGSETVPWGPEAAPWHWQPVDVTDVHAILAQAGAMAAVGNVVDATATLQALISRHNLEDWGQHPGVAVAT